LGVAVTMGACLSMADEGERRAWGSVPAELHRVVVEEYERTGLVPPANTLAELAGMHPTLVRRTLKQLCDEGFLAQPHGDRSGYIPLRRPDGTRVRPALLPVEEDGEVRAEGPQTASEILEEALRKVRALEGR
jgi:DNA-binding transcriptional regulator YhcF (GntR family)